MTAASTQPEPVAELVARLRAYFDAATNGTGAKLTGLAEMVREAADVLASMSSRLADAEAKVVELVEETGSRDAEDLADMARVGHSLLEEIAGVAKCPGPFNRWGWSNDPAEIVTALFNALHDATAERDAALALAETSRGKALEEAAWQPIETAPQDGTLLILACTDWPFDWKPVPVKIGGWDTISEFWKVFGASWTPTHWQLAPVGPARSLAEASDRAPRDGETEQEERV